jgi:hypothetical protein
MTADDWEHVIDQAGRGHLHEHLGRTWVGLMFRPACSPTADPARSEPVSVTPRTRGSAM